MSDDARFMIFLSMCVLMIGTYASLSTYFENKTIQTAMENGYIQQNENGRTIWVKE